MSSPAGRKARLAEGASRYLEPLLVPAGFTFRAEEEGPSSGGPFASGAYARGPRRLELHLRHRLGLIRLSHGKATLSLGAYLRAVGGWDAAILPGADGGSLDAFAALGGAIGKCCGDFVHMRTEEFARIAATAQRLEAKPRRLP